MPSLEGTCALPIRDWEGGGTFNPLWGLIWLILIEVRGTRKAGISDTAFLGLYAVVKISQYNFLYYIKLYGIKKGDPINF